FDFNSPMIVAFIVSYFDRLMLTPFLPAGWRVRILSSMVGTRLHSAKVFEPKGLEARRSRRMAPSERTVKSDAAHCARRILMRIASLVPSATETLFALGLGDEVVGVSPECDFPAGARDKPVLSQNAIRPDTMSQAAIDRTVVEHLRDGGSLYHVDARLLEEAAPEV